LRAAGGKISARHRLIALLTAFVAIAAAPSSAPGATIGVTTTADDFGAGSSCSLREALKAAEDDLAFGGCGAGGGADIVNLPPGTYGLTRVSLEISPDVGVNDLDVLSPVTIRNPGRSPAVIDANDGYRVFSTLAAEPGIQLVGLTIRGGNAQGDGGAVNNAGELTIRDSTLTGNFADDGEGGAIFTDGNDGALALENVTVSANRADESGGGISVEGGQHTIRNSTLTGNVADADAAGGATEGGGIFANVGGTSLRDTIVAGNTDRTPIPGSSDCAGQGLGSLGNNLIGDPAWCEGSFGPPPDSDLVGADPKLGPLADNGGPSGTHALLDGSEALDRGSGGATSSDQRGVPRSGAADIGAYERVECAGVLVNRVGTAGRDLLTGTAGRDGILGLAGRDKLKGRKGRDSLCGGAGRDRLLGGGGRDRLLGGRGRDILLGGPGRDKLRGGPGRDRQVQ
jgi:CSLREA domain-containing protein